MKYYEVSAKYVKMDESGKEKKVSEQYLVDAISCSEAESRTIEKLKEMISGEFNVVKIAQSTIGDIIDSEVGDRWFKAKVAFLSIDEETGKEKRITQTMLVFSDSVQNADAEIKNAMKSLMAEFVIVSISESPILEVWPYLEGVTIIPNVKSIGEFLATNEMIPIEIWIEATNTIDGSRIEVRRVIDPDKTYEVVIYEDRNGGHYEESELIFKE